MKEIIYYFGVAVQIAGIMLIVYGMRDAYMLYKIGKLSFDVMNPAFWFNDPNNYLSGIAPHAKWLVKLMGAWVIIFFGRAVQNRTYQA